jgi:DNA-binding NarL/FixJ family response regulator
MDPNWVVLIRAFAQSDAALSGRLVNPMAKGSTSSVERSRAEAIQIVGRLDEAELELLALLVLGESTRSVATKLGTGPGEIEARQVSLMQKLSATTTAEAVRLGLLAGIDR